MKDKEVIEYNKRIAKICESNKAIAEFMGAKIIPNQGDAKIEHFVFDNDRLAVWDLKYDSSWDWLMPVVEKIENLDDGEYFFDICGRRAEISVMINHNRSDNATLANFNATNSSSKMQAIWLCVVEFIKQQ